MRNLKKYFGNITTILLTNISVDGYIRTLNNDVQMKESNKLIEESARKSTEIANKLVDTIEQNMITNLEVQTNLGKIKESIDNIQNNVYKLSNVENNEINQTLNTEIFNTLKESVIKTNNLIDKILEFIKANLNNNNFINNNILSEYNQFFDSLTFIQKGAIVHTLVSISVLFLLSNLLSVYYGDKLIIYFNLENKYPKLARFIQIRRKFQDYYIRLNALIIILILLVVIYINIKILIYY